MTPEGDFSAASSWKSFDLDDTVQVIGAVYDGRYVYFCNSIMGASTSVLRYDTEGDFDSADYWVDFNITDEVNSNFVAYGGVTFDGQNIYFVPFGDPKGTGLHGKVLKFNINNDLTDVDSWNYFDAEAEVDSDAKGFSGGVFDGQYIYFIPALYGKFLRYDTEGAFDDTGSWVVSDVATADLDETGYTRGVFDSKYIYFTPTYENFGSGYHGRFLRYDTESDFIAESSWTSFDAEAELDSDLIMYRGAAFDGKYTYFFPFDNGSILRHDTEGAFTSADSWTVFDATGLTDGIGSMGWYGASFDGQNIYLSVYQYSSSEDLSGKILKFNAKSPSKVPDTVYGGSFF